MNELIDYIGWLNAKAQAEMDASPGTWISMLSECPDHWASCCIFTVEAFERDSVCGFISDVYKDIHGVRPRHLNMAQMSIAELDSYAKELVAYGNEQDRLTAELEAAFKAEEKAKAVARKKANSYQPNQAMAMAFVRAAS